MSPTLPESIETKLHALCESLSSSDEIRQARHDAEAFLANEEAVHLYREVTMLGRELQRQHHEGIELDEDKVTRFELLRASSSNNSAIQSFEEAQDTLQNVANYVNFFVTKTLERGTMPSQEELLANSGCCGGGGGGGCGCSH